MNENKGLNFIIGLVCIFIIWKLYSIGFLHQIGFMGAAYLEGIQYSYGSDPSVVRDTPLGAFASLLVDIVTILGYLASILLSGIWDIMKKAGVYLQDLFQTLRIYLEEMTQKKKEDSPEKPKEPDLPKQDEQQEESPIKLIVETLKEMQKEINSLKENKVSVTKVVPQVKEKNNE